ncbi:hypothetical protein Ciccas_010512 [Cichlidogyrus casuarinus]|uniref:Potassium channel domain-containing protein n=1 Tax=Cichlidogyrus casuarinus TaxID=1844966 RepID=A0ABD2PTW8_9PLAT
MLYAVFGIPLFFSYLSSNGDYMARMFRLLYARGCRPAFRKLCRASSRPVSEVASANKNNMSSNANPKELPRNAPMDRLKTMFLNPKARQRVDQESGLVVPVDGTGDSGIATDHVTTTSESSKPAAVKSNKTRQKLPTPAASAQNGSFVMPPGAATSQGGTEPANDNITVPISVTVSIMTIYIVIGACIFQIWERDSNFLHWSYFCFITLSTIGFGDIVPG